MDDDVPKGWWKESKAITSLTPKALFDSWIGKASPREIEYWVDKGFRHKSGATLHDAFTHWLSVARHFGYATHDDSFGEFEKEFSIIITRMVIAERHLAMLRSSPPFSALVAPRCEFCGTEKPTHADVMLCREHPCRLKAGQQGATQKDRP